MGLVHTVAVLALDGVVAFDVATPCDIFRYVRTADGVAPYAVQVCGAAAAARTDCFVIVTPSGLDALAAADTVVVPGVDDPEAQTPPEVLVALRKAWANGARLTSICTGSFILAEAGLLEGRRATTHWKWAAAFSRRFPGVQLDADVLFVDEGRIVTSAGLSAGLDMCLHLVRRDHGQAIAARSARLAVAPLDREGGQAQYILREPPGSSASLGALLSWMAENLQAPLTVETLAKRAGMSPRTFARRFKDQTGATPMQWLTMARVRRAQELLETSDMPLDSIGLLAGFEAGVTFRMRFKQSVGMSPGGYRRRFLPSTPAAKA